jgi:hypothetical protein
MKVAFRGQYLYVYSGPEFATEIPAEEWIGIWRNIDETKRTEIINAEYVGGVDLLPDLFEVHLYLRGRKTPRQFKMVDEQAYQQVVQILQSGLSFDV